MIILRYIYKVFSCFLLISIPSFVLAEDINIDMLNKLNGQSMVFSEVIVNVNSGDTIFWNSVDKGHNVEFIKGGVPEGVEKFKSKVSKDTQYTFSIPGIYAYWCTPHKSMGMIGFVIVDGDLSNLDLIKKIKYIGKSKKIASILIEKL